MVKQVTGKNNHIHTLADSGVNNSRQTIAGFISNSIQMKVRRMQNTPPLAASCLIIRHFHISRFNLVRPVRFPDCLEYTIWQYSKARIEQGTCGRQSFERVQAVDKLVEMG
jgi:hypothetical protein